MAAKPGTVTVPVAVDFPHEQVRAVADQAAKVARCVHTVAVELDRLASLMEGINA